MKQEGYWRAVPEALAAPLLLALLTLLYWKLRIVDSAVNVLPSLYSGDIYAQHFPMTEYGFATLRAGRLPLWNPYQLCGVPFLATAPYVGLFYPLNLPYLLFGAAAGTEITLILHMLLGAVCMWCLQRHFGIGRLGALCSAVTFVWSGWLIYNVNQPSLYDGMAWMPLSVLLVDRVAQGSKPAQLGLVLAVSCQILQGAAEVFAHVMYVCSLFALARLIQLAWQREWKVAIGRGGVMALCVAAGTLLAAVQWLPTMELLRQSVRASGALSFEQISAGAITPFYFLTGALEIPRFFQLFPLVTVGCLPLLAIAMVIGSREHRLLWTCALICAVAAALLAMGGPLFRLYYATPLGPLFRRPTKFLDIYSFGQALLAGLAIARLESWADSPRRQLWTRPAWLAALVLGVALAWWTMVHVARPNPAVVAMVVMIILFGVLPTAQWRRPVLVAVVLLQSATLFFITGNRDLRPWQQADTFTRYDSELQALRARAGHDRTYIYVGVTGSNARAVHWGITSKQMRHHLFQPTDRDPLVTARSAAFFEYIAPRIQKTPFLGAYALGAGARWRLMDLTGTRYFVSHRGEYGDAYLAHSTLWPGQPRFNLIQDGFVRIYERPDGVLPRAYVVPNARVVSDPQQVLETLDSPQFDPRREAILEEQPARPVASASDPAISRVDIIQDDPERVVLTVTTNTPGFLVLSDSFYPGWDAFVDDDQVRIYRANYLFRAVQVDAGSWVLRFEYRPASFRIGAALSIATAVGIAVVALNRLRPRQVERTSPALHAAA